LSDITEVWQLYFGLLFIAAVMYAPGGIAGLIMMHRPVWRARALSRLLPAYALMLAPIGLAASGAVLIVEMIAHLAMNAADGNVMPTAGFVYDIKTWQPWVMAVVALAAGSFFIHLAWRKVRAAWAAARLVAREKGFAV
jgi:branched-chain amino acid transport system permease protein